jgi:ribosomal protein S18 acetylase RimI-like enzyme
MSVLKTVVGKLVTVRSLEPSDLASLSRLQERGTGRSWIKYGPHTKTALAHPSIWVAAVSRLVVGYIAYEVLPEPDSIMEDEIDLEDSDGTPLNVVRPPEVELLHIEVASDWQRRGIGRMLLERFTPQFSKQGIRVVHAAVPESNLSVQLLLRSAGYRAVQTLRGHFGDEAAYLMERRLG